MNQSVLFYMEKCREGTNDHHKDAIRAKSWDNVLSTSSMIITGIQAFTMTVLLAVNASTVAVTITGASFALVLGIANKTKDSYSFKALGYQHHNASDEYASLYYDISNQVSRDQITQRDLDTIINKYQSIEQKGHLQSVKDCCVGLCCLARPTDLI